MSSSYRLSSDDDIGTIRCHDDDHHQDYSDSEKPKKHECCSVMPSKEFLMNMSILTNLSCPVLNCGGVFSNISALNFHLEKSHRLNQKREMNSLMVTTSKTLQQKELECCDCKYYCPEAKCKYNAAREGDGVGGKFLPSFYSLKNHFIRMHGAKSYACDKCCKLFSIKSELHRHQEKCGLLFKCSCGCFYSSKNALLKHQRLKGHHSQGEEPRMAEKTIVKLNLPGAAKNHFSSGNSARLLSSSIKIKNLDALPRAKDKQIQDSPRPLATSVLVPGFSHQPIILLQTTNSQKTHACVGNEKAVGLEETRSISCQTSVSNVVYQAAEMACQTSELFTTTHEEPQTFQQQQQQFSAYHQIDQKYSSPPPPPPGTTEPKLTQTPTQGAAYHHQHLFYNSQETQTQTQSSSSAHHRSVGSTTTATMQQCTDEYYLDASTSTSPFGAGGALDPFGESLWNEISTQTNLSSFQMAVQSNQMANTTCATNTDDDLLFNTNSIQTQTQLPKTATIGVGDSYAAATTSSFSCDSVQQNVVVLGNSYFENYAAPGTANNHNQNPADAYYHRCLTPPAASVSISSTSTQTQNDWTSDLQNGNNFVDMITQTEWNFDF